MGFEILAIAFGLSTFSDWIIGSCVRVWGDNNSGEASVRKASFAAWDHTCLTHAICLFSVQIGCEIYIDRVLCAENISDCSSCNDFRMLQKLGAKMVAPFLDASFCQPSAWEFLSAKGRNIQ